MCILCEIQKWSRRVATMLPWLVIPLIGLWAISQLLPPAFRFEITSPRLACVFVLLITLFWYEILMPKLSAWRVRRNARLRERKRIEAIEIQKLRKTAIRRCRNCLTPYRDQNPGGGKFTCLYCGHISKRPVLDLPASLDMESPGIMKYIVGKGGTMLNGKAWSENGNWVGGPFDGKSNYWKKNGGEYVGVENHCLAEKSYSHIVIFTCKVFTAFFLSIMWLWRKIFRVSSSSDDTSTDAELMRLLHQRDENGGNFHESRGEKARRKAEEKRQARLEKELLEEEEKKQREEVARMVEERRRLRDEKLDKQECEKEPAPDKDRIRNRKNEAEKKHREGKKERDRGSSKSNSDAEESEKRVGQEGTRNMKIDSGKCEQHRTVSENVKSHSAEAGHGCKGATTNSHNRGTAGTRYLDHMKGTLLSSSRALTGGGFLGKNANISTVSSEHRLNASVDHVQGSAYKKDVLQSERVSGRSNVNADDKNVYRPVVPEPQPCPAPKKSWQQLFTRSSAVSAPSNPNVIGRPTVKSQTEVRSPPQLFDGPVNFGQLPPSTLPSLPFGLTNSSRCHPLLSEATFPRTGKVPDQLLPEESENFEDPCYIPDPVSLLGPVSESLDNFDLDLGFVSDTVLEEPRAVKTTPASSEVTKPSPIQSPLSRSRVSEERHGSSFPPSIPKSQDNSNNANDDGTWQMWNSSPLGQAGIDLVGGPVSWLLPPELSRPMEDIMHPVPQKTMASLFKNDEQIHAGNHSSQKKILGNFQNADSSVPSIVDGPWLPETLYGPTTGSKNQMLNPREKSDRNGILYGSSSDCIAKQQFDLSGANSWAKKERTGEGLRDVAGNSSTSRPHIGGLYSTSDQHLWSYD